MFIDAEQQSVPLMLSSFRYHSWGSGWRGGGGLEYCGILPSNRPNEDVPLDVVAFSSRLD